MLLKGCTQYVSKYGKLSSGQRTGKASFHSCLKERRCQTIFKLPYSSVQSLSCVWLFVTPWTAASQVSLFIINSWSLLKFMFIESVMPSNRLIFCHPLLLLPSIVPRIRVFTTSYFFTSSGHNIGASASASVLPMNIQDWLPLGWNGWIPLQSKGNQESSPTPQFKSINSSALSFLYSPTLTPIHDHWKNHSLD